MGEKFGSHGSKTRAGRSSWWPCVEWGSSIITTPIMVGDVVWGYGTPYPLLLGKELRNPSLTVKHQ